ncbi:MAG: glutaredoxin family protein [Pirellulaceae bacterium]|jgi:glutaredoxin|nr:glutaredoxin family protein [Planctomycetaceae bacterium]MDB4862466.1 glutaredoxin family protein [Pirellulaceae bacterium]
MSSRNAVLYTRKSCQLCDEAKEILEMYGFSIHEIDIDTQPKLLEKYDTCVPVVEIDGKVRFRGTINEVLLVRLIGTNES